MRLLLLAAALVVTPNAPLRRMRLLERCAFGTTCLLGPPMMIPRNKSLLWAIDFSLPLLSCTGYRFPKRDHLPTILTGKRRAAMHESRSRRERELGSSRERLFATQPGSDREDSTVPSKSEMERELHNAIVRLGDETAKSERLFHTMNLLENNVVDWFATHRTLDGCEHSFGVGIAMNVSLNEHDYHDIWLKVHGAVTREIPVVFWRSHWIQLDHRYISVYDPEEFKRLSALHLTLPDAGHSNDPLSASDQEISDMVGKASALLDAAQERYRAARTPEKPN